MCLTIPVLFQSTPQLRSLEMILTIGQFLCSQVLEIMVSLCLLHWVWKDTVSSLLGAHRPAVCAQSEHNSQWK